MKTADQAITPAEQRKFSLAKGIADALNQYQAEAHQFVGVDKFTIYDNDERFGKILKDILDLTSDGFQVKTHFVKKTQ